MATNKQQRQRILYLHARSPNIRSDVVGAALHEPIAGSVTEIDPDPPELPYESVHAAVVDGWRVVQFPDQRTRFEDREIDVIGYEFILEKIEGYDE
jgi:hypothetical protein